MEFTKEAVGSFVARAHVVHVNNGLSQSFVLRQDDEGRFSWYGGSLAEPLPSADSESAAQKVLEEWTSKFPDVKVEWL
jgi:hypothetical protein